MKHFLSFIFVLLTINYLQAQNSCGLIENSTLESGLSPGWTGDNFVTVVDTTSHQGTHSLAFLPDPNNPNLTSVASSSQTVIPAGSSFIKVSFWVHVTESYVSFDGGYSSIPWGGCHVAVAFLTNDGGWLGKQDISEIQNTVGAQSGFVLVEQTIPVASGAEKLQLFVTKRGPGYMFLDDICATPASSTPVSMGPITAFIYGNQLEVNWSTLTENNNDYFEVLISKDGKTFNSLGTVNTKAIDGNSTTIIDYSFTKELPASMTLLAIPAIIGLFAFSKDKKRKWIFVCISVLALAVFFSCNKSALIDETARTGKVFVQIKQFDKDGLFKLSPIKEAVIK